MAVTQVHAQQPWSDITAPKQKMISTIQLWVSEQNNVSPDTITVMATDRRLQVPECRSGFQVSRPFGNAETVQVECRDLGWRAIVSIKLSALDTSWLFATSLPAGHQLVPHDLRPASNNRPAHPSAALVGKILKVPVRAGQRVHQRLLDQAIVSYRLTRDVPEDWLLSADDVSSFRVAASYLPDYARLELETIVGARTGRDLAAGYQLRGPDLKVRNIVLKATALIERGAAVTATNSQRQETWTDLPSDVFPHQAELPRAVATARISPGQIIRHSQLRILPEVVAGERVDTIIVRGNLEISVPLEAQEDGRIGQQINLRNPQSGQLVSAIVTGARQAKIR